MAVGLIVVLYFTLEEVIGLIVICDFFEGQQTDQAPLESAEESLDFTFCLRRRSHAVVDPQSAESPLELGKGVQSVLGRGVAKEAQTVGIETGRAVVLFEGGTQQTEMAPSGIDIKAAGHDFARVVISR